MLLSNSSEIDSVHARALASSIDGRKGDSIDIVMSVFHEQRETLNGRVGPRLMEVLSLDDGATNVRSSFHHLEARG